MPAARPLSAADDQRGHAPLSSWYTQGLSDGLGDRLLMFDNQATGPLELLRVRPDFAFVPDFETRLRGRLERLTAFTHPGFAQSRAVDHLDNGEGLTVVSTHVPGTRLSEIFQLRPTFGETSATGGSPIATCPLAVRSREWQERPIRCSARRWPPPSP